MQPVTKCECFCLQIWSYRWALWSLLIVTNTIQHSIDLSGNVRRTGNILRPSSCDPQDNTFCHPDGHYCGIEFKFAKGMPSTTVGTFFNGLEYISCQNASLMLSKHVQIMPDHIDLVHIILAAIIVIILVVNIIIMVLFPKRPRAKVISISSSLCHWNGLILPEFRNPPSPTNLRARRWKALRCPPSQHHQTTSSSPRTTSLVRVMEMKMIKIGNNKCWIYWAPLHGMYMVVRMLQASWDRGGKQQQELTSPNHVQAIEGPLVVIVIG